jgi:N-acylneuraminate cytidylyltransferase
MNKSPEVVALVPMKGHSERVPRKNLRMFHGEPLLTRILKTLNQSAAISKIIVNTDSDEIAQEAQKYSSKVIIHFRPEQLCGDFVSTNKLIEYDLSKCPADYFLQTHATNPLLTTETIDQAMKYFFDLKNAVDSVFSVTEIQNRFYDHQGRAINHDPKELIRTQDLNPLYEENSNFYLFSQESFRRTKNRIGSTPYMYKMNKLEAIDIDNEVDFILAETVYTYKRQK